MGVSCELATTTMLLVLDEATQVCAGPQSCDGAQPPHVCPHPSSPQVFPVQLGVQLAVVPPLPIDPPDAWLPPAPPAIPPLPVATPPAPPLPLPPVPLPPAPPLPVPAPPEPAVTPPDPTVPPVA